MASHWPGGVSSRLKLQLTTGNKWNLLAEHHLLTFRDDMGPNHMNFWFIQSSILPAYVTHQDTENGRHGSKSYTGVVKTHLTFNWTFSVQFSCSVLSNSLRSHDCSTSNCFSICNWVQRKVTHFHASSKRKNNKTAGVSYIYMQKWENLFPNKNFIEPIYVFCSW